MFSRPKQAGSNTLWSWQADLVGTAVRRYANYSEGGENNIFIIIELEKFFSIIQLSALKYLVFTLGGVVYAVLFISI